MKRQSKESGTLDANSRKARFPASHRALKPYRRLLTGFIVLTLIQASLLAWAIVYVWQKDPAQSPTLDKSASLAPASGLGDPSKVFEDPLIVSSENPPIHPRSDGIPVPAPYEEHHVSLPPSPASPKEGMTASLSKPSPKELRDWQAYAVAVPEAILTSPQAKLIAIIIDDVGIGKDTTAESIALPSPVTLSFLSYASNLSIKTAAARAAGHELMLHLPMEPSDPAVDPGRGALLTGLPENELLRRLDWALNRFEGYVGINNHMGSKFTTDSQGMTKVLEVVQNRNLLFLDSKTAADSVGFSLAQSMNIPTLQRDVFLDNEASAEAILTQLQEIERIAEKKGAAIAIGHPYPITLQVLQDWIPDARSRGFQMVPVSAIWKWRQRRGKS